MRIKITSGQRPRLFSRAARLDQLTTLWTNGILRDPEAFAELADIPTPQIITTKAYDVRLARNENLTMADGTAVQANSWDDHTIHLREHNNFRKTAAYQELDEKEQASFEFHCSEHTKFELKKLQDDAQKAQLVQQALGTPPPGGAGAPGPDNADQGTFYKDAAVGPGSFGAQQPDPTASAAVGG
jgi:hypothetical protein